MNCPNCSNGNISLFHDKVWSIDNGKVYQCSDCELIFINPMMSVQEESKFYKNYNQHVKDRGVIAQNSVREFHEKRTRDICFGSAADCRWCLVYIERSR